MNTNKNKNNKWSDDDVYFMGRYLDKYTGSAHAAAVKKLCEYYESKGHTNFNAKSVTDAVKLRYKRICQKRSAGTRQQQRRGRKVPAPPKVLGSVEDRKVHAGLEWNKTMKVMEPTKMTGKHLACIGTGGGKGCPVRTTSCNFREALMFMLATQTKMKGGNIALLTSFKANEVAVFRQDNAPKNPRQKWTKEHCDELLGYVDLVVNHMDDDVDVTTRAAKLRALYASLKAEVAKGVLPVDEHLGHEYCPPTYFETMALEPSGGWQLESRRREVATLAREMLCVVNFGSRYDGRGCYSWPGQKNSTYLGMPMRMADTTDAGAFRFDPMTRAIGETVESILTVPDQYTTRLRCMLQDQINAMHPHVKQWPKLKWDKDDETGVPKYPSDGKMYAPLPCGDMTARQRRVPGDLETFVLYHPEMTSDEDMRRVLDKYLPPRQKWASLGDGFKSAELPFGGVAESFWQPRAAYYLSKWQCHLEETQMMLWAEIIDVYKLDMRIVPAVAMSEKELGLLKAFSEETLVEDEAWREQSMVDISFFRMPLVTDMCEMYGSMTWRPKNVRGVVFCPRHYYMVVEEWRHFGPTLRKHTDNSETGYHCGNGWKYLRARGVLVQCMVNYEQQQRECTRDDAVYPRIEVTYARYSEIRAECAKLLREALKHDKGYVPAPEDANVPEDKYFWEYYNGMRNHYNTNFADRLHAFYQTQDREHKYEDEMCLRRYMEASFALGVLPWHAMITGENECHFDGDKVLLGYSFAKEQAYREIVAKVPEYGDFTLAYERPIASLRGELGHWEMLCSACGCVMPPVTMQTWDELSDFVCYECELAATFYETHNMNYSEFTAQYTVIDPRCTAGRRVIDSRHYLRPWGATDPLLTLVMTTGDLNVFETGVHNSDYIEMWQVYLHLYREARKTPIRHQCQVGHPQQCRRADPCMQAAWRPRREQPPPYTDSYYSKKLGRFITERPDRVGKLAQYGGASVDEQGESNFSYDYSEFDDEYYDPVDWVYGSLYSLPTEFRSLWSFQRQPQTTLIRRDPAKLFCFETNCVSVCFGCADLLYRDEIPRVFHDDNRVVVDDDDDDDVE